MKTKMLLVLTLCLSVLSVPLFSSSQEIVQDSEAAEGATLMDALEYIMTDVLDADTLILVSDGGVYGIDTLRQEIIKSVTIMAAEGLSAKPQLSPKFAYYKGDEIWQIYENVDFELNGILFDGTAIETSEVDSIRRVFRVMDTGDESAVAGNFTIKNCEFRNVYKTGFLESGSEDGKLVEWDKGSRNNHVTIENCIFTNFGDEVFNAGNGYKVENGYNFNSFHIRNCTFNNIDGCAIKLNDDTDPDNWSPSVTIENCTFYRCQRKVIWTRDFRNQVVKNILISTSIFGHENWNPDYCGALMQVEMPGSYIANIDTFNCAALNRPDGDGNADDDTVYIPTPAFLIQGGSKSGTSQDSAYFATLYEETVYSFDPGFADPENGDFTLDPASPVNFLADDGRALGDRRWAPEITLNYQEIVQDADAPAGATLMDAIKYIMDGTLQTNVLVLTTPNGVYGIDTLEQEIIKDLTIMADPSLSDDEKPVLRPKTAYYKGDEIWQIYENVNFKLKDIVFDGTTIETSEVDSIRRVFQIVDTGEEGVAEGNLIIENCDFKNVYKTGKLESGSEDGKLVEWKKGSRNNNVFIENCTFTNFGDEIFNAGNGYKVEEGYNFRSFHIRNCTFNNIDGCAIKLNDDADPDNISPRVVIENCTFYRCQRKVVWTRDFRNQVVKDLIISTSIFGHENWSPDYCGALLHVEMPGSFVSHIDTFNCAALNRPDGDGNADDDTVYIPTPAFLIQGGSKSGTAQDSAYFATLYEETIFGLDPMFADPENGDFTLSENSPLLTLASDGGALGDRNWVEKQTSTAIDEEMEEYVATAFNLSQNYPNPFNPTTNINFTIPENMEVKIQIYNIRGQLVETLFNYYTNQGTRTITWQADGYPSGVYFCRMIAGNYTQTIKMMLLK